MTSYTSAPTYRSTSGYLMDAEGVLRRPISTLTPPPPMSLQQQANMTNMANMANMNVNSMPTPVPAPPPALHPMMYTLSTGGIPSNSQYYYGWQGGPISVPTSSQSQSQSPSSFPTTTAQLKDNKNGIDESAPAAIDEAATNNVECNKINVNTKMGCDSVKDVPNLDSIKLENSCNVKGVNNTTSSNKNEKSKKESERTYCF